MRTRTRLIHWAPDQGFPLKTACGAGKGPRLVDTVTDAAALITCRRCQRLQLQAATAAADRLTTPAPAAPTLAGLLAAFVWCPVCRTQHHPDNSTCDGLRGGTTDRLTAPAPVPTLTNPITGLEHQPLPGGGYETAADVKRRQLQAPTLTVSPGAQAAIDRLAADLPAAAGDSPIAAALQVLVLDPRIRAYLATHDPQALRQAATALHGAGLRYQATDGPADLCWYCFLPLTRVQDGQRVTAQQDGQTVCQECRHSGRAVQPQQLEAEAEECAPDCASRVPFGACTCGRVDRQPEPGD